MTAAPTGRCPVHHLSQEYNPFTAPQKDSPFAAWATARDEAPVFFSDVLQAYVVTRFTDVDHVLRNPGLFSSDVGNGSNPLSPELEALLDGVPDYRDINVLVTDPPRHKRLRMYMQKAFIPKNVSQWESEFARLAEELIDTVEPAGAIDFYRQFATRFSLSVLGALLRLPIETMDNAYGWAEKDINLRFGSPTPEQALEGVKARRHFYEFGLQLVRDRRTHPQDDFLSAAIADSDRSEEPMSDDELVGQVMSLLVAGHETTANWLTLALRCLLQDRSRWEALVADPDAIQNLVEETLRLQGPAQALWRRPTEDVEIEGVQIPAGSLMSVVIGAANRDAAIFDHPDDYDPLRADAEKHVAFGRGIHVCVGAGVARAEGRVALTALARRLPQIRLDDSKPDMTFVPNAIQRMPRGLYVTWS